MYVCTKCGGKGVEGLSWFDLNSGENQEEEVGEYYCNTCAAPCDVEYVNTDFDEDIADEVHKEKENEENNS